MSSNPNSPSTDLTEGAGSTGTSIRDADEPLEDDIYGLEEQRSLSQDEEEEEGEDLFGDNLEAEYRPMPALDAYDTEDMDDEGDYEALSIGERRAAERAMDKRDGTRGFQSGFDHLLYSESDDGELPRKKRRRAEDAAYGEADELEPVEDLQDTRGHSVKEWVLLPDTRTEIANRFRNFLRTTVNSKGRHVFRERMRRMCENNDASLIIDYPLLAQAKNDLAYLLPEAPFEVLSIFDEVAKELVMEMFPNYSRVAKEIHVRIAELPLIEDIRTFRKTHLNQLIRTTGVVSSTTGILPQLSIVKYDCVSCGTILGPYPQTQNTESGPGSCSLCQSTGPFLVNMEETIYRNYQKIVIQEPHNKIPGGRIPRSKPCILLDELCDRAKVGDEIDVTGIYTHSYDGSLNTEQGFPVFSTIIIANYIVVRDTKQIIQSLTDDDINMILKLSKDRKIVDKIVQSIAPSIYGYDYIKRSLALALFGGESKNAGEKHRVRGDINVLICGDPGTAKSQFLKYIEQVAPRAIYTTGQGASAVGLTAYVKRNTVTKEWTLEAGALVLADQGICLIDEFDKMNDRDRTSIHEAMEQQTISISKAGIVTSLQARCSIIAAANPIGGIYESYLPFASNVNLSEPILSRFDVLCVVRDEADLIQDQRLAEFVCNSHVKHHPRALDRSEVPETRHGPVDAEIPQDLLRKYIVYAKQYIHPTLEKIDQNKIAKLYSQLRQEALATGSMPITARHIESLIRMSEAQARMHLREVVIEEDVNVAIRILLESFVDTQKFSVMKVMKRAFHKYLSYGRETDEILYFFLRDLTIHHLGLARSKGNSDILTVRIPERDLLLKAKSIGIDYLGDFYQSKIFKENNFVYNQRENVIVQTVPNVGFSSQTFASTLTT